MHKYWKSHALTELWVGERRAEIEEYSSDSFLGQNKEGHTWYLQNSESICTLGWHWHLDIIDIWEVTYTAGWSLGRVGREAEIPTMAEYSVARPHCWWSRTSKHMDGHQHMHIQLMLMNIWRTWQRDRKCALTYCVSSLDWFVSWAVRVELLEFNLRRKVFLHLI